MHYKTYSSFIWTVVVQFLIINGNTPQCASKCSGLYLVKNEVLVKHEVITALSC